MWNLENLWKERNRKNAPKKIFEETKSREIPKERKVRVSVAHAMPVVTSFTTPPQKITPVIFDDFLFDCLYYPTCLV